MCLSGCTAFGLLNMLTSISRLFSLADSKNIFSVQIMDKAELAHILVPRCKVFLPVHTGSTLLIFWYKLSRLYMFCLLSWVLNGKSGSSSVIKDVKEDPPSHNIAYQLHQDYVVASAHGRTQ